MYFSTSVYFETTADPDKISEEILNISKFIEDCWKVCIEF
jgi:hypothetical protein